MNILIFDGWDHCLGVKSPLTWATKSSPHFPLPTESSWESSWQRRSNRSWRTTRRSPPTTHPPTASSTSWRKTLPEPRLCLLLFCWTPCPVVLSHWLNHVQPVGTSTLRLICFLWKGIYTLLLSQRTKMNIPLTCADVTIGDNTPAPPTLEVSTDFEIKVLFVTEWWCLVLIVQISCKGLNWNDDKLGWILVYTLNFGAET